MGVLVTVVEPSELVVVVSRYLCPSMITMEVDVSSSSSSEDAPPEPPALAPALLPASSVEVLSVVSSVEMLPVVLASSELSPFTMAALACLI
jgi:hypothetical protein